MITLIVVDYQSLIDTFAYIRAFRNHAIQEVSVVVVDNKSDTNALQLALDKYKINSYTRMFIPEIVETVYQCQLDEKEILVVQAGSNLGYAKGNNLGARIASKRYGSAYYLFSNNDLMIDSVLNLETLTKPMEENEEIGATGPRIITPNGDRQSPYRKLKVIDILFSPYFNLLLPKSLKYSDKISGVVFCQESMQCYWVSGSFLCVHSKRFEESGCFDEGTFLYYEEMILSERFASNGYSMYFVNDICLIHNHGQTIKNVKSALWGIRQGFRSSVYYVEKYRGTKKFTILIAKINFMFFSLLFSVKKYLKKILEKYQNRKANSKME